MGVFRRVLQRLFDATPLQKAAAGVGAARGRGLVLLYHQVVPAPNVDAVTPALSVAMFEQQLRLLAQVGDVVPLADALGDRRGKRPRFAITFDDDYESHARYALPVLERLGLPATFFLSGRWLHGLGPYWWEQLDQLIATMGVHDAAMALDVTASSPAELAARLEVSLDLQAALPRLEGSGSQPAPAAWTDLLLGAAVDIGFHTLQHPRMTILDDDALAGALRLGRLELAEAAGRELAFFAYPHGRAARREAMAVEAAGFHAAFTTSKDPVGARSDRYLAGRWEPDVSSIEEFAAELAWRLNAPIRPARH